MSDINYSEITLRTIDAVQTVRVYDVTTGGYVEKQVTRFQDNSGAAQDIRLNAYQYTANGKVQTVSMSQLFMTICMQRANDVELETVALMDKMSENTAKINELSDIEDIYLNGTTTNQYNVWCSMDFGEKLSTIPICYLAEELGLELPDCVPNYDERVSTKTITASELEEYKAFLSQIIEENRARLAQDSTGSTMGARFGVEIRRHQYYIGASTLTEAFNDLFGASASEFTTCQWYNNTDTLGSNLKTITGYQVGNQFFDTLEQVYAYAKDTYGIDMTQSQSAVTTAIENKLDGYNSISQEDMIELQSLVSKRDQSYTLVSNALKSMNNSNLAAANNF